MKPEKVFTRADMRRALSAAIAAFENQVGCAPVVAGDSERVTPERSADLLHLLTVDVMFALDEARQCKFIPEAGEFCCAWNRHPDCDHCADLRDDLKRRFAQTLADKIGSGNQAAKEQAASPRRSAAQKSSS